MIDHSQVAPLCSMSAPIGSNQPKPKPNPSTAALHRTGDPDSSTAADGAVFLASDVAASPTRAGKEQPAAPAPSSTLHRGRPDGAFFLRTSTTSSKNSMSPILIAMVGWFVSPIIRSLLPKVLVCLGFDASDKLLELEIHIIPELKKTLQAVDQERMMQRGKRVKTDLDALDKMAAMLRHALEDAEDIFDDAQEKIVVRGWHHLYGAFTSCIARCKCCCVWIARIIRTKSPPLLQCARDISLSLFLLRRSEEPVRVNSSAAVVSNEPVEVAIDIPASEGKPDPMTTSDVAYGTVPVVSTGAAVSDEPDPVITSATTFDDETALVSTGAAASGGSDPVTTCAKASGNEIVLVTTGAAASDNETVPVSTGAAASGDGIVPVTTSAEASDDESDWMTASVEASYPSGRWLSYLCSSFDFFKNCCASLYNWWLVHVFEAACFYRDWSYQVVGIKKCQENASLFDILDILLTAISRGELKKRIQKGFPVRVRLHIPTYRAWTAHKTILLVCLSLFEKIMHALNVLGCVSVTVHPLPVHLRALYIIKCVKNHYRTSLIDK